MSPRWRLILAAAVFLGWMAWLGYAALTKSHAPIVSHAQAAAATAAVVADLGGPGADATVAEKLWGDAPDGAIHVANLPGAHGYAGPGQYLLLLTSNHGVWQIVGPQRSPGNDPGGSGPAVIYPWSDAVRKQAEALKPNPTP